MDSGLIIRPPLFLVSSSSENFSAAVTEITFKKIAEESGLKSGDLMQLQRVILIGQAIGPLLFEMIVLIGKTEVIRRIDFALSKLP